MGTPGHDTEAARCPRCAYDQRGPASAWSVSCPLEGTCAECGLVFRWCEVLRPDKFEPRWLVEYAAGFRGVVASVLHTALRSLLPGRFWSRVRMSQPVRPYRLVLYLLALLAAIVGGYVFAQAAAATRVRWVIASPSNVVAVNQSYPSAILEAVLVPLASRSRGTVLRRYRRQMFTARYPSPATLHENLVPGTRAARRLRNVLRDRVPVLIKGWAWSVAVCAVVPVAFALLPVSRRRAKVRWSHIVRVAVYSAVFPALFAGGFLLAMGVGFLRPTMLRDVLEWLGWCLAIGAPACLVLWWASAVRRYLQMPNGLAVASLLIVLSALALSVFVGPMQDMFVEMVRAAFYALS